MTKILTKENRNLTSLILGILLILTGLTGTALFISKDKSLIIYPIITLVIGAILALLGGLRKW